MPEIRFITIMHTDANITKIQIWQNWQISFEKYISVVWVMMKGRYEKLINHILLDFSFALVWTLKEHYNIWLKFFFILFIALLSFLTSLVYIKVELMILLSHDYEIFLVAMQAVSLSNKLFQYLILSPIMTTICLNSLFTHIHILACN